MSSTLPSLSLSLRLLDVHTVQDNSQNTHSTTTTEIGRQRLPLSPSNKRTIHTAAATAGGRHTALLTTIYPISCRVVKMEMWQRSNTLFESRFVQSKFFVVVVGGGGGFAFIHATEEGIWHQRYIDILPHFPSLSLSSLLLSLPTRRGTNKKNQFIISHPHATFMSVKRRRRRWVPASLPPSRFKQCGLCVCLRAEIERECPQMSPTIATLNYSQAGLWEREIANNGDDSDNSSDWGGGG